MKSLPRGRIIGNMGIEIMVQRIFNKAKAGRGCRPGKGSAHSSILPALCFFCNNAGLYIECAASLKAKCMFLSRFILLKLFFKRGVLQNHSFVHEFVWRLLQMPQITDAGSPRCFYIPGETGRLYKTDGLSVLRFLRGLF